MRVGKVINKYKVAKHVKLEIQDDRLEFQLDEQQIACPGEPFGSGHRS